LLKADPRFAGITINFEAQDGLAITADRDQLEQIYWNLLMNAADAMPDGGTITVSAVSIQIQGKKTEQKDLIRIDVSDTGHGMTELETRHLFEPFFTTKTGGTGLGLATVYRIIEANGGRIFVDSTPAVGSVFSILLPAG
jgi:two-component system sensor histidine kinase PilS (NtrC family)